MVVDCVLASLLLFVWVVVFGWLVSGWMADSWAAQQEFCCAGWGCWWGPQVSVSPSLCCFSGDSALQLMDHGCPRRQKSRVSDGCLMVPRHSLVWLLLTVAPSFSSWPGLKCSSSAIRRVPSLLEEPYSHRALVGTLPQPLKIYHSEKFISILSLEEYIKQIFWLIMVYVVLPFEESYLSHLPRYIKVLILSYYSNIDGYFIIMQYSLQRTENMRFSVKLSLLLVPVMLYPMPTSFVIIFFTMSRVAPSTLWPGHVVFAK